MIACPVAFDTVLVVDFGAQYAQLIARRVRECHVYSEIVPSTMPVAEMLAKRPKAIILSGGPSSVYADGAPPAPAGLFEAGVPGPRHLLRLPADGGRTRRHGRADRRRRVRRDCASPGGRPPQTPPILGGHLPPPLGPPRGDLLAGTPASQRVWMSHGDTCTAAPPGFAVTAQTGGDAGGRGRGRGQRHVRRPVPPRGHAHRARHPPAQPLPRAGRLPPVLDHAEHRRGAGRARSASRSATATRSAGCPAGWTPRSPPRSCSAPSATA